MTSTVRVESELPAATDRVWAALQRPSTMAYVCRGVIGFPAAAARGEPFRRGDRGSGWIRLFHVVPLHRHTIEVVELDAASRTVRTAEHGGLLRSWHHTLHVEPVAAGRCRYSDTVEIDAGALTAVVVAVARALYRYRHRRWKLLARRISGAAATS